MGSCGIEPHTAATSGDPGCFFLVFFVLIAARRRVAAAGSRRRHLVSVRAYNLLVEGLGVGRGGGHVGVTGGLVGASGELELVGRLQVGIAGGAVGGGVVFEVEKKGEHD